MPRIGKHCLFRDRPCAVTKERQSLGFLRLFLDVTNGQIIKVFPLDDLLVKTGANIGDFLFPYTVYRK